MKLRRIHVLMVIIILLLTSSGCQGQTSKRSENVIIQDMVRTYGRNPQNSQKNIEKLQKELRAVNSDTAEVWTEIMDYWDHANQAMPEYYDTLPDGIEQPDALCLIVLGYQLNSDGSMQPELIGRLETARNCANQYPECYVLCTGGGTAARNSEVTEAGEMAKWLAENGIAPERIIVEDQSLSTIQNAEYSFAILQKDYPQIRSCAIVTSDYHIPWGAVLFQTEFLLNPEADLSVISHAAFLANNHENYNILSYQTSGILSLAGLR